MAVVMRGFTVVPYGSPLLGVFEIPGTKVRLSMRREVAPLLVAAVTDFHREVEELVPGWCWGHAPKKIEGTNQWSEHAWGGAVDLNAPRHAMGKRNTFTPGERKALDRILDRYTYKGKRLLRSGKDYVRRADDMHLEVIGQRADVLAAIKLLQAPAKPKPKPPAGRKHAQGTRVLELTEPVMSGFDVGYAQRWIGVRHCGPADEDYGPRTVAGVRWWQADQGLTVDGVMGSQSWTRMLGRPVKL
jgi:hypothetical protein